MTDQIPTELARIVLDAVPDARAATGWRRLLTGNSRVLWSVDVTGSAGESRPLVVRVDEGVGPLSGTALDSGREAVAYRALAGRGVRMPALVAERPGMLVLERLPGSDEWAARHLGALLAELSRLHAVPVASLALPGWGRTAEADLELWATIVHRAAPDPVIDAATPILRDCFPGEPDRSVLCHGDAGPGNALFVDGRLSGLLDWEFAHVGDPMDDLAWVAVRLCLLGIDSAGFAAAVARHYGGAVDPARFRYWRAVVLWRNLIACRAVIARPEGADTLVQHMIVPALRALLVDELARISGTVLARRATDVPELQAEPASGPGGEVLRDVGAALRALAGELANDRQRRRVAQMRVLVQQLADTWGRVPPADIATGTGLDALAADAARGLAAFPRAARIATAPPADLG